MVICLERDADLHTAQLMPLPLTVSCFSKIQIGFTFLVPAHLGSPGKGAVKRMCVCVTYIYAICCSAVLHCNDQLQKLLLPSTMRRLGEEIYGSGSSAQQKASCSGSDSHQSSDGQFFHSSDLRIRFLSTMIVLRTINQGVCLLY